MNQRFQSAEIRQIAERYAGNELYQAVSSIGPQLEAELTEFGLCPEECFMEACELLSEIAEKGEAILPEVEDIWLSKHNEYRRFDRHVGEDEIRKAVAVVFGFVILAIDSSRHPFYRYTLSRRLMETIARHPFSDWSETLHRIFSVPLADGWFDAFIEEEPDGDCGMMESAKYVDSIHKKMPCSPMTIQFVQNQYNSSCQQFMGKMENPKFITPRNDEAI